MDIDKIYNEDCLEGMKQIPDASIDMILCVPCSDLRARLLSLPCISSQICTRTAC